MTHGQREDPPEARLPLQGPSHLLRAQNRCGTLECPDHRPRHGRCVAGLVSGDGARGDEPVLGLRPCRGQHSGHRCLRGAPGRERSPGTARKTPPHTQAPAQDLDRSCGRKCATVGRTGLAGCNGLILRGRGTLLHMCTGPTTSSAPADESQAHGAISLRPKVKR